MSTIAYLFLFFALLPLALWGVGIALQMLALLISGVSAPAPTVLAPRPKEETRTPCYMSKSYEEETK